jgi:hypothetical protein
MKAKLEWGIGRGKGLLGQEISGLSPTVQHIFQYYVIYNFAIAAAAVPSEATAGKTLTSSFQ